MKRCPRCKSEKPFDEFYRDRSRSDGRFPWCKICHRAHSSRWAKEHPDVAAARRARKMQDREYRAKYLLSHSDSSMLRRYGCTLADYAEMYEAQDGKCAICKKDPPLEPGKTRRFNIDHDHLTGRIRALLCPMCNRGLGQFLDDPEVLREAAAYVEHYRAVSDPLI